MFFFRVRGYCIVLTNMKAMSFCFFYFLEDIFSMQFFRNIQRKADSPQTMEEFEITHQIFAMMTKNIARCNLKIVNWICKNTPS